MPFQYEKPAESPGFSLWRVHNVWQQRLRERLKIYDLTHVQFILLAGLAWLSINKKYVTQIMLARHTEIDVMMASVVIRKLEQKALIIREDHPEDTRAKVLIMTTLGVARFQETIHVVEEFDKEFFSVLGEREDEFSTMLTALAKTN